MAEDGFTPEQRQRLTHIWDRLYELYLEQVNGARDSGQIDTEIQSLIAERDAIRPWGWNTGQNWKDGIPPEELKRMMGQK
ncbi:MAG TPA: hypothetical protein VGG57_22140 [Stellaceae bacterium]|jgi:hypothetical protein